MASFFDINGQAYNYVTAKLINPNGTGGGSNVPNKQIGATRVPVVSRVRLVASEVVLGGAQYALTWLDAQPGSDVSHYNVWITGALSNNQAPIGPFATSQSPCYLRLVASQAGYLTFFVQTVLNNGSVSDIATSPCCTGVAVTPAIATTNGSTVNLVGPTTYTAAVVDTQINCNLASGTVNVNLYSGPANNQSIKITVGVTGGGNTATVAGGGNKLYITTGGSPGYVSSYSISSGTMTIVFVALNLTWYIS